MGKPKAWASTAIEFCSWGKLSSVAVWKMLAVPWNSCVHIKETSIHQ
jgi:hypothetical protein